MGDFFTPCGMPYTMEYVMYDLCGVQIKKAANQKGEVEVLCPLVKGKSFEVNIRTDQWNCFKKCAGCPGGGGILDLYVLFSGVADRRQAHREIMDSLNGNAENAQKAMERREQHLAPVKQAQRLSAILIDKTYRALLDMLTLSDAHHADLVARGMSQEDIERMGFKSLPQGDEAKEIPVKLVKKGLILKGVPGFFIKECVPSMANFGSGYFIPYRDREGLIIGLQIRYDIEIRPDMDPELVKKLKKKRYRWFTSSHEEGGASAGNVPFWGIPGRDTSKVVYATEGGLKAATAQSLSNGYFVAIPGVTCYAAWEELLTGLKADGVTTLVDAFDSDRATNRNVDNAIKKLHAIASDYGFEMKSWNWGTEQKGVDDYLLARKKRREAKIR